MNLNPEDILVVSLFTMVPVIPHQSTISRNVNSLFCLTTTNDFYEQVDGMAMESILRSTSDNFFMKNFEK